MILCLIRSLSPLEGPLSAAPDWLAVPEPGDGWMTARDGYARMHYDDPETARVHVEDQCGCDPEPAEPRRPGFVYTLHFEPPLIPYEGADSQFCAYHYTGHAEPGRLATRLAEQASGGPRAAKIVQHQIRNGGQVILADLEPGGYDRERQLKRNTALRRCHLPHPHAEAQAQARAEAKAKAREVGVDAARWSPEHAAGAEAESEPEAEAG